MNERELMQRKKESCIAFIIGALLCVLAIIAFHFGLFDAVNPFDGK